MPETVEKMIADVRGTFPDASPDIVLDCLNTIHQELCLEFPVETATYTVNVQSGVGEYDIDDTVAWIRAARYMESADSWQSLSPTNADEMDSSNAGWRWDTPSGIPSSIYIDGGKVGLYPIPDSTTSGTYPKVEIVATVYTELAFDSVLPDTVRTRSAWVNGARMLIAHMMDRDRAGDYAVLYERSIAQLARMLGRRNRHHRRVPQPRGSFVARQV